MKDGRKHELGVQTVAQRSKFPTSNNTFTEWFIKFHTSNEFLKMVTKVFFELCHFTLVDLLLLSETHLIFLGKFDLGHFSEADVSEVDC